MKKIVSLVTTVIILFVAFVLLTNSMYIVKENEYDAYTVFSIYSDLETCYKQLSDYEKAYLYASKKLSLIEAFKS